MPHLFYLNILKGLYLSQYYTIWDKINYLSYFLIEYLFIRNHDDTTNHKM